MSFGDELNNYMKLLNCNSKDICDISGISPTVISRYLNNKRTPKINSDNFDKIVNSLYQFSNKKQKNLSEESIRKALISSINPYNATYDVFIDNLNTLQSKLNISTTDMAKEINFDASFLSRIKNMQRKPSNIEAFIDLIVDFFGNSCQNADKKQILISLFECTLDDIKDIKNLKKLLKFWLTTAHKEAQTNIESFLSKLDIFNLNNYIGTDFSKVKVPTSPVIIKNSKTYYGIEGRKRAEGNFLKTTLLSKSKEPIFFYNDLPMTKAGNDEEFKKKWIVAMTMLLKKGLHLNIVHNINRPLNEMLLGLESWIPIYMTGSISPYYYAEPPSNYFQISHCTSGSVALSSECMDFDEKKSRFYLTTKKEELAYAKKKAAYMLSKAQPLMTIFKEEDTEKYNEFMNKNKSKNLQTIKKDIFKNIDFCINEDEWIMINKNDSPKIHFVIYNEQLKNAIKDFLNM